MREIKFRARAKDGGEWMYGNLLFTNTKGKSKVKIYDRNGLATEVDVETIGQYTGLRDEKGAPLYEGDIVHGSSYYLVTYNKKEACFKLTHKGKDYACTEFSVKMKSIAGNMHEEKFNRILSKV